MNQFMQSVREGEKTGHTNYRTILNELKSY